MRGKILKKIFSLVMSVVFLFSFSPQSYAGVNSRMDAAEAFVNTVLKYCRYLEGSKYPELLVLGVNTDTMAPVEWQWSGNTYYPANFFSQQNFMRTLVGLTNLTGNQKYKEIAKRLCKLWFDEFTDKNGLIYTGAHTFVDAVTGEVVTTGDHEMKNNSPYYELMYEVDPEATVRYMEAFWNAHITDWSSLSMNRHGPYDKEMGSLWENEYTDTSIDFKQDGVAFQSTGTDLIEFALFVSEKTGDKKPGEWALRLLQKYIDAANPETGLSGAQYGELESGDRAWLQFGEEFGELAKEYNFVDRGAIAVTAGYTPQVLLSYYEGLSDSEKAEKKYILDYVVKSIEGVAKYAYDAETNTLKTPMWSDGTSLQGYELRRNGYYGNKGSKLGLSESIEGPLLSSAIAAYIASGSEIIWEFARNLAKGYNLGDIGTAPGENVALKMSTTARSGEFVDVMINLYKETGTDAYLSFAEKLGNNILTKETQINGMFLKNSKRFNARICDSNALSLMALEAALKGEFDIIPGGGKSAGIDMYHDGVGRITCGSLIFNKNRVNPEAVSLNKETITIPLINSVDFTDVSGHSTEKAIKQMAALGVLGLGAEEMSFGIDFEDKSLSGWIDKSSKKSAPPQIGTLSGSSCILLPQGGSVRSASFNEIIIGNEAAGNMETVFECTAKLAPTSSISISSSGTHAFQLQRKNDLLLFASGGYYENGELRHYYKENGTQASRNIILSENPGYGEFELKVVIDEKALTADVYINEILCIKDEVIMAVRYDLEKMTNLNLSSSGSADEPDSYIDNIVIYRQPNRAGAFKPDSNLDCREFIKWCARLCNISEATLKDANISSFENMTKEEMSFIIAKALICKNSQTVYSANDVLAQFEDRADISEWARDYCDIAANYYMVNERGDEYFYPKKAVTRAEAAEALKKLSNLFEITAEKLSCGIAPETATVRDVMYTSSNPDIVEVDENGRIFPINAGNAVITVTCGNVSDSIDVTVVASENWMLKSIEIDGKKIEEFSPVVKEYREELLIGTTQMPSVQAVSYSGEAVTVIMPKILPGVVKLYVEGESDNPYTVSLLPEKIDYVANESFDAFPIDTVPHSVVTDKAMWYLHSSGWENGYAPVKIAEHPIKTGEGNNVVAIPYKGRTMEFSARFHDTPYIIGENAEDGSIVVEYDLMTTSSFDGLEVRLLDYDTQTAKSARILQLVYSEDAILYCGNSNLIVGSYTPGVVHSVKMILDKKTLKTDLYFNGNKVLSEQLPEKVTAEFDILRIRASADLDVDEGTMVYVDNVKIYELPAMKTASVFYDSDGNRVTHIGSEAEIVFQSEVADVEEGKDIQIVCAICSLEGIVRRVAVTEKSIQSKKINTTVRVNDMSTGDFLCVYVWTEELRPLLRQMYIYKC